MSPHSFSVPSPSLRTNRAASTTRPHELKGITNGPPTRLHVANTLSLGFSGQLSSTSRSLPRDSPTARHVAANPRRTLRPRASASGLGEGSVVAVVGGTGFIGRALVAQLLKDGSTVRILTRSADSARSTFAGKPGANSLSFYGPATWADGIKGASAVVNLAGTPISTRWTPSVKEEIIRSRVETTTKVVDAILSAPESHRPTVLVNSSAVGFYGASETGLFDESSRAGTDFLAKVCVEWEAATKRVEGSGVRLVVIRNGIVLERDGGALAKMIPIFELYAGGPLGSGSQWMSWIHRDDMVGMFVEAIRNADWTGVVNGCAPNAVRVSELSAQLGRVLGKPSWLPVPEFALKALLGEGASVVLDGQRVVPKRAEELGFKFQYRYVSEALGSILK